MIADQKIDRKECRVMSVIPLPRRRACSRAAAAIGCGANVDPGGDLFDEIPDVLNGPPPFRQDIGRQREVVNLSVPEVQIAANAAGFQAFRHELGVRKQQFIGARVDGDRRQGGQIGVHR